APPVAAALGAIQRLTPEELNNTYAVGLQAMALSLANPIRFQRRIAHAAAWLERGMIKRGGTVGAWSYNPAHGLHGDNSNTHYAVDPTRQRAVDWMATHFSVGQNPGVGEQWKYYYLYGLERAGRLTGLRYFGDHDWYREGAEELVRRQDRLNGSWSGDTSPVV